MDIYAALGLEGVAGLTVDENAHLDLAAQLCGAPNVTAALSEVKDRGLRLWFHYPVLGDLQTPGVLDLGQLRCLTDFTRGVGADLIVRALLMPPTAVRVTGRFAGISSGDFAIKAHFQCLRVIIEQVIGHRKVRLAQLGPVPGLVACRCGSKATGTRSSDRPLHLGRSSSMSLCRDQTPKSTNGHPSCGPLGQQHNNRQRLAHKTPHPQRTAMSQPDPHRRDLTGPHHHRNTPTRSCN